MVNDMGKSIANLLQWSGMASILAGVISPLAVVIHPFKEDVPTILSQTARLVIAHSLFNIAYVLTLLGLVGLLVYQAGKIGRLGRSGFILAFTGTVLFAISGDYGFFAPVLAAHAPAMLDAVNAYLPVAVMDGLMVLSYVFGFILFGVATVRAGVLPRIGGIFLVVGVPLFFTGAGAALGLNLPFLYWIAVTGQLLMGLGLIVLGLPLWSMKSELSSQLTPVIAND
jgi:hypothetical protein